MDDIKGFQTDLDRLAKAITKVQIRLNSLNTNVESTLTPEESTASNAYLMRRKEVLAELGMHQKVGRASWSHDRGDAIIFDAWDDIWESDSNGNRLRYPMRTDKKYVLSDVQNKPERGHTRWQHHLDLVLSGKRTAITIIPIRRSKGEDPNRRTRGWLPQYATGEIKGNDRKGYWFYPDEVVPI